jgi:hypothetical protein
VSLQPLQKGGFSNILHSFADDPCRSGFGLALKERSGEIAISHLRRIMLRKTRRKYNYDMKHSFRNCYSGQIQAETVETRIPLKNDLKHQNFRQPKSHSD